MWCGRPFEPTNGPGRPRVYCKPSCRQRDYEARRRAAELGLGEHELVVTRAELEQLRDRLYLLRLALDDVERDLADAGDEPGERERVWAWLLEASKQAVS